MLFFLKSHSLSSFTRSFSPYSPSAPFSTEKNSGKNYSTSQITYNVNHSKNNGLDVNTLELFKKLNGDLKINDFDPNVFGSNGFYRIKDVLSSNLDSYAKQELIEKSLKNLWEIELKEYFKNMKSLNDKGLSFLIEVLSIVEKDFETLFENKKLLSRKDYLKPIACLDYSNIISICLSKVLPFIILNAENSDQQVTTLCESIGIKLYKEVVKHKYDLSVKNIEKDKEILYKNYFQENYIYSNDDEIKLGLFILTFISDKTDLFYIENSRSQTNFLKNKRLITPGKLFNEKMENFILFDSYEAPMLVKPVEWVIKKNKANNSTGVYENEIVKYGGYLFNDKEDFEKLIRKSKESVEDSIIINDKIVDMVNFMSSVPFKLNLELLNYIINLIINNENNKLLTDLHLSLHPDTYNLDKYNQELLDLIKLLKNKKTPTLDGVIEDLYSFDDNIFDNNNIIIDEENTKLSEKINTVEDLKYKIYEILSHNSKFYYNKCIITMGLLYKDVDELYFPLKLDWRGRIYIKGGVLNIQGGELSRSLLLFNKSYPLDETGLEALKIYCANSFGKDKFSKIERIEWVNKNINQIIDIDSKFWETADDKLIALACAFELKGYYKDPINFKSSLPILIDATCNGVQHLSAMIQDITLAEKVNLLQSSKEIKPNDLYSLMIEPIKSCIQKFVSENPDYSRLSQVKINRSLIKVPIMTISYNISPFGICEQLLNEKYKIVMYVDTGIHDKKLNRNKKMALYQAIDTSNLGDVLLRYKDIFKLSEIIYDSLYKGYPKLNELRNYFNAMANILSKLNIPIIWVTPSGLHIRQKYVEFTTYDIVNNVLSKKKKITLRKRTNKINSKKQIQALIPNYVHSMDATNIILLYDALKSLDKKIDLLTIHDCFGTHANDINYLSTLVKNAFISIYKDNKNLKKFHSVNVACIKSLITVKRNKFEWNGEQYNIPSLPKMENMNLEKHLPKSLYFLN